MCILIQQPKGHTFSNAWLADFYKSNADGIGVMYAQNGQLIVKKSLPKNVDELIQFYRNNVQGKECFIHYRMRTHGDINLDQCHPYEIFGQDTDYPLYLMHNGVLSTGNAADTTKSDTWHYIDRFIRPALKADPSQFTSPWFKSFIETHIGSSNKFAILDKFGNSAVFNKSSGVMWGDVWMSNTYAWSADKAGVYKKSYWNTGYGSYGGYGRFDAYDDYAPSKPAPVSKVTHFPATPAGTKSISAKASWDVFDSNEFKDELLRLFRVKKWNDCLAEVKNQTILDFYLDLGYDEAYSLIDMIIDDEVQEEDVLYLFAKYEETPAETSIANVYDLYVPTEEDDFATGAEAAYVPPAMQSDEDFAAVMREAYGINYSGV